MRRLICISLLCFTPSASAQSVDEVVAVHSGGCTTAGFEGLSEQLVRSHLCSFPGVVAEFTPHPGITLTSSRVHPLALAETVRALRVAADETPFAVNSAFRPLVQQYALYHEGGCGLAAIPGNSNHQSGRAVDVQNYEAALSALLGAGCTHPYPSSDPVHFDCPGPDMRSASVVVFQRLWNLNHPDDPILEDSIYGTDTAARLGLSPARGFASDLCEPAGGDWGAEQLASTFEGVLRLAPGEEAMGTIEFRNIGLRTWSAAIQLATTGPRDRASGFVGGEWLNDHRVARVDGLVPPGESYPFTFTLRAPETPGEYTETFGLVQDGETSSSADAWFSDGLGPLDDATLVRVVVMSVETDAGVAGGDGGDGRPLGVASCSVDSRSVAQGRALHPWWLVLACLAGLRRPSRTRDDHL